MIIDRGERIDYKMFQANLNLQNENKGLKYDVAILEKKIRLIKNLCQAVEKNYPNCKPYASRILFIIETGEDEEQEKLEKI